MTNQKKENKGQTFLRIAKPRVERVLKSLRILGNCSNRSIYDYNQEQIGKMFKTIRDSLNIIEAKFSKTKQEQESFDF